MKTEERKSIQSAIQLPSGLWFTSKRDFAETLFNPLDGKTAFGFYSFHKSKKYGTQSIRLRKGNGELFAIILSNGLSAQARTAWEEGGKVYNLYGLTDEGTRLIGLNGMSYSDEINACIEIVNKANGKGEA